MEYPKLPGLTPDGTLYRNLKMGTLEAFLPTGGCPTAQQDPQPGKAAWPGLRCPVAIALSEDEGKTFPLIRCLELGEGYIGEENRTNNRQYEYPFLIQSRDGALHLAYAAGTRAGIQYIRTTEAEVMGARRERTGLYNPTAAQTR